MCCLVGELNETIAEDEQKTATIVGLYQNKAKFLETMLINLKENAY